MRFPLAASATFGLVLIGVRTGTAANCNTLAANDCTTTACTVDCDEGQLRQAADAANNCAGSPSFQRTVTFNFGCGGCTINMVEASNGLATCSDDPTNGAVCLYGHNITIDGGNGVTFNYVGTTTGSPPPCVTCTSALRPGSGGNSSDFCEPTNPALFTLRGNNNIVKNFKMQYFPEGIHIQNSANTAAHDDAVIGVTNSRVCNRAIAVDSGGATAGQGNHVIQSSTITAGVAPDTGRTCYTEQFCLSTINGPFCPNTSKCWVADGGQTYAGVCTCTQDSDCGAGWKCSGKGTCYYPSNCGTLSAVELDGPSTTMGGPSAGNTVSGGGSGTGDGTIDCIVVNGGGGTQSLQGNTVTGCYQGLMLAGGTSTSPIAMSANTVTNCSTGAGGSGWANLTNNTFQNDTTGVQLNLNASTVTLKNNTFESGNKGLQLLLSSGANLEADGNRFKNYGAGSSPAAVQVLFSSGSNTVDLGGGALQSPGGNSFCQAGSLVDVNNSGGAVVSATKNCFDDSGGPTPNVVGTVSTSPAYNCTAPGFAACSSF
jgi:hypothetical protein